MSAEAVTQRGIWLAMGGTSRLFRLNTGKAYISGLGPKGVTRLADGSVVIKAARPIALGFGLTNGDPVVGACDLPGWTTITVTPEMVGHKIAVFTSVECKSTEGKQTAEQKATPEQKNWRDQIVNAGGIAGIASTPEAALAIVSDWHNKFKQSKLL